MAQRYGGKYSPDDAARTAPDDVPEGAPVRDSYRGAKRSRIGARVRMLFIAPLPLMASAFGDGPQTLALTLSALGLLLLAAWMTREGLAAQEAYEARRIARRPTFPRKMAGSVLTGLGLGLAGYAAGEGVAGPLIYVAIGAVLHFLAFGPDPMKNKGIDGIDAFQSDRVARAVSEAEAHLTTMQNAILRAGDRALEARVAGFATTARTMFRTLEDDPRDLTQARKYLSVYLRGARDATVKFADLYSHRRDASARADYETLLGDLQSNFTARIAKMRQGDRADLTVEIEVLRDRLAREGLTVPTAEAEPQG